MGKQNKKDTENITASQELIVYGVVGSGLILKDGKFDSFNGKGVDGLNAEIGKYNTIISQIGPLSDSKNLPVVFRIMVKGDAEALRNFLLEQTNLIDGAYIKAPAENPGDQSPKHIP